MDLDAGDLLEVAPAAQLSGRYQITLTETRIPGLFAAGEAAGGSTAPTVRGNALLIAVFGRIAGEQAAIIVCSSAATLAAPVPVYEGPY